VQYEGKAGVLKHRAVRLFQDVLQVLGLVIAYLPDVWIEPGFPGAIADLARELGKVLGIVAELVAV
jgi:hypothetical protein